MFTERYELNMKVQLSQLSPKQIFTHTLRTKNHHSTTLHGARTFSLHKVLRSSPGSTHSSTRCLPKQIYRPRRDRCLKLTDLSYLMSSYEQLKLYLYQPQIFLLALRQMYLYP